MLESMLNHPEMLLVTAPCLAAVLLFLNGGRARGPMVLSVVLISLAATGLVLRNLVQDGAYSHALGGWGAPLGIEWRVDGLAGVMLLLNTLVGAAISLYSLAYYRDHEAKIVLHFWPLWLLLWGSLYALFLSHDIFNWYVTLELSGLSAVALITLSGTATSIRSAMRYLLYALAASLFFLAGVGVLYAAYGVLDLDGLSKVVTTGRYASIAMALMVTGLCVKAALFPFHFWLPPAHASAPSPVSAALSALVVKGGFYIILRLLTELFPHATAHAMSNGLGMFGAVAIAWGSYHALRQQRVKMIVAYSTVAQLGYLFLAFPLIAQGWWIGGDWASRAWAGGVYHALSHGLAKAALFLAAGVIIFARGNDRLDSLKGLGERLPVTATAMALAGVSLMAIPPGAGFVAKWLLLTASINTGQWGWAAVMIGGGLAAVGYLFRIFRMMMMRDADTTFSRPPRMMEWVVLLLAVLSVGFGLYAVPVFSVLAEGAPPDLSAHLSGATP